MRKPMPWRAWSDEASHLSHKDQKGAAPDGCAMNPARRPQIVRGEQKEKDIRRGIGCVELMEQNRDVPAIEGRPGNTGRSDDDEALVRRRIAPQRVSEPC